MRYYICLTIAFFALFSTALLMAQEEAVPAPNNAGAEAGVAAESAEAGIDKEPEVADQPDEEEEASIDLDNPEDADLDDQTYESEDDDFVPTQEIPADTPIPFPSNI